MTRARSAWLVLALVAAALDAATMGQTPVRDASGAAAPARAGTASISGIVVTGDPAQHVRRATVTLTDTSAAYGGRASITDDAGRFSFEGLRAGRYLLSVSKAAYLTTAYGVTKPLRPGATPTGTALSLQQGQQLSDLRVPLQRGAVVTGTIRGPDGQGIRGASVSLVYYRRSLTGERMLVVAPNGGGTTDGRGVYRLFGLLPGEYLISAIGASAGGGIELTTDEDVARLRGRAASPVLTPPVAGAQAAAPARRPNVGYVPIFHPGTPVAAEAAALTLAPGEERTGLDITVQLVPLSRLVGTLVMPDGRPARDYAVQLWSGGTSSMYAIADAQGRYILPAVPPRPYLLTVVPSSPSAVFDHFARADVVVSDGRDVSMDLTVTKCATLSGRLVAEPDTSASTSAEVGLRIRATYDQPLGLSQVSNPAAGGVFTITCLPAGRVRLGVMNLPRGSFLKSAMINGQDAVDASVEVGVADTTGVVTLTSRASEISGTLTDAAGRPAPEYFIIAFPTERAFWTWNSRRIQPTRPANDGTFAFRNLPAGEYRLAAVTDVEQNEWFEPAFLEMLMPASVPVTLADGGKTVQHLRVR
jgi:uncharacterized protein (DUF2141 family)